MEESIAMDSVWSGDLISSQVSVHEFGHNFAAIHDDAKCVFQDDQLTMRDPVSAEEVADHVTVMGVPGTPTCVDRDDTRPVEPPQFSPDNVDNINGNAGTV